MENVRELFALPIELEPVTLFGSVRVYTSESLRNKYIAALSEQNKTKPIIDHIEKLVKEGTIVPCYLKKGIVDYIISKMNPFERVNTEDSLYKKELRHSAAFFEPRINKLVILIDNNLHFLSFVKNSLLADLTIHESMHMLMAKSPTKFISIFKSTIQDFYYTMYTIMFDLNQTKEVQIIINNIIDTLLSMEAKGMFTKRKLMTCFNYLEEFRKHTKLDEKTFDYRLSLIHTALSVYIKSTYSFFRNLHRFWPILQSINATYESIYGRYITNNIPIQELILPSEVICISTELNSDMSRVYTAFKQI